MYDASYICAIEQIKASCTLFNSISPLFHFKLMCFFLTWCISIGYEIQTMVKSDLKVNLFLTKRHVALEVIEYSPRVI